MSDEAAGTVHDAVRTAPYVHLAAGYPPLSRDIWRNLCKASRRLIQDRVTDVIRFWTGATDLERLRPVITEARAARLKDAGRPDDPEAWERLYDAAGQVVTLELDGFLAAWELAAPDPPAFRVLAGQMVPGWERYRPGRLLEEAVLRRVLEDPAYTYVDWGSWEHAGALIAVS